MWNRVAAVPNPAPSRARPLRLARLALVLAAMIGMAAPVGAAEEPGEEFDLEGTWYVLIHYKDADTPHPERDRWDDRLWVFERRGSRLKWTEYPIVVFSDQEGRFERSEHGQRRVLHAWEPNAGQKAEIASGLEFNTRGSKTKSLRRKRDKSWKSAGPSQMQSASTVGYHETWAIEGLPDAPVFLRDDILGAKHAESMSGRTLYATEKVSASGNRLRGRFARDEARRGTFRMVRSGDAKSVGTKRTLKERTRDALRSDGEAPWGDSDGRE